MRVISIWKPEPDETTQAILAEWGSTTQFVLPRSVFSIAWIALLALTRSPIRLLSTARLAFSTSRPGIRGLIYQSFYFGEAIIASDLLHRAAITHVHNHIGDSSGTVTMLAAKLAGVEYSITFHGWPVFFDAKYSSIKEKVQGAAFTRAISYFCQSQLMMFSERDDPRYFSVVHCGLEIDRYAYRSPREEIKFLFCAARLSAEKGIIFLLCALKLLRDMGYDLEIRLAGDGPAKSRLMEMASKLGLAKHVHFLGYLDEEQVIQELQQSDIFVLPSFVEGLSVSAMEAMAVGLPVIATNIAGMSELVEDGRTGILVRPSDGQAIADAVIRMIADYPFRLRVSECGRKKVAEEFNVHTETAKLSEYFFRKQFAMHEESAR